MAFNSENGKHKNKIPSAEDRLDRSCRKKMEIIRTLTLGKTSPKDLGICVTWLGILCRAAKKEAQERDCLMELMLRQLQETGQLSLPFTDPSNCDRDLGELLTPEGLAQPQLPQPMVSKEKIDYNPQEYQWREKLQQLDQLEVLYKHGEWIDSTSTAMSEDVRLLTGTERGCVVPRVKAGANTVRFTDKPTAATKLIPKGLSTKPRVPPVQGTSARQRQDRELRIMEINHRKEKQRLDREFRAKQREQERAQLAEQIRLDREQMLTGQRVWQQERQKLQQKVKARIEHERYLIQKKREELREQDERTRQRLQRDQLAWEQMHQERREMERLDRIERARLLSPNKAFVTIMEPKKRMESGDLQVAEKVISWMVLCPSCRENVRNVPSKSILHSVDKNPQLQTEEAPTYANLKEKTQTNQEEPPTEQPDDNKKEKSLERQRENRNECDQGTSTVNNIKRIQKLHKEQMIEMVKLFRQSREDQIQKRAMLQELEVRRRAAQLNTTPREMEPSKMDEVPALENNQGFQEEQDSKRSERHSKKKEELELALQKAELMEQHLLEKLEREKKEKDALEKKVAEHLGNLGANIDSKQENRVIEQKNIETEESGKRENNKGSEEVQVHLINSSKPMRHESPFPREKDNRQQERIIEEHSKMGNLKDLEDNTKIDQMIRHESHSMPKEPEIQEQNKESDENREVQENNTKTDEMNKQESSDSINVRERQEYNEVCEEMENKKKNHEVLVDNIKSDKKKEQVSPLFTKEQARQEQKASEDIKYKEENQEVLDDKSKDDEKKLEEKIPQEGSIPLSLLFALGRKWEQMERKNKEKREREKNEAKELQRKIDEEDKENYDYERLRKKGRERTKDAIFKRKADEKLENNNREGEHEERREKEEVVEDKGKAGEKLERKRDQDKIGARLLGKSENFRSDAMDPKKKYEGESMYDEPGAVQKPNRRLCPGKEEAESRENKNAKEERKEFEMSIAKIAEKIELELRDKVESVILEREEMERTIKKHHIETERPQMMESKSMEESESRKEVMVQMERKAQIERRVNEDLEKKAMEELFEAEKEYRKREKMQIEHLHKMREQSQKGKEEMKRLFQHYTSFWKNRNEVESEREQGKPEEGNQSSPEMESERLESRKYCCKDTKSERNIERIRRMPQRSERNQERRENYSGKLHELKNPVSIQIRQLLKNSDYEAVLGEEIIRKENELKNRQYIDLRIRQFEENPESPTFHQSPQSGRSWRQREYRSEGEETPPGDMAEKRTNVMQFNRQVPNSFQFSTVEHSRRRELGGQFKKHFEDRSVGGHSSQYPRHLHHHSPIREINRQRTEANWLKADKDREQRVRSIERLERKLDSERRCLEKEGGDDFVWMELEKRPQEARDRQVPQRSRPQNYRPAPVRDLNPILGEERTSRYQESRDQHTPQRSKPQNNPPGPLRDHNRLFGEEQTVRPRQSRDREATQISRPQNNQTGVLRDNRPCGDDNTVRCQEPRGRQAPPRSVPQNFHPGPLKDHNRLFGAEKTVNEESPNELISSSSSGKQPEFRLSLVGRFCPERGTYVVGPNDTDHQGLRHRGGEEPTKTGGHHLMPNPRPPILKSRQKDKWQPYEGRKNHSELAIAQPARPIPQTSKKVCNTKCKNFHMTFLESAKRIIAVLRASNANPSSSESSEECAKHLGKKLPEPIFRNLAEPLLESSQDLAQNLMAIVSTLDEQLERHVGHLRHEWNGFLDQRRTVTKLRNQLRQAEHDQTVATSRASVFHVLYQWWNLNRSTVNLLKDLFSQYCNLSDPLVKETLDTIEWFYGEWSLQKLVFEQI